MLGREVRYGQLSLIIHLFSSYSIPLYSIFCSCFLFPVLFLYSFFAAPAGSSSSYWQLCLACLFSSFPKTFIQPVSPRVFFSFLQQQQKELQLLPCPPIHSQQLAKNPTAWLRSTLLSNYLGLNRKEGRKEGKELEDVWAFQTTIEVLLSKALADTK